MPPPAKERKGGSEEGGGRDGERERERVFMVCGKRKAFDTMICRSSQVALSIHLAM